MPGRALTIATMMRVMSLAALRKALRAAALAIVLLLAASPVAAANRRMLRFPFQDRASLAALADSGRYELVSAHDGFVDVIEKMDVRVGARSVGPLGVALALLGQPKIVEDDLDRELDGFRARGTVGAYHTVAKGEAELKDLAARYPVLTHLTSIGKTFEGRDIWALRITGKPQGTTVPKILVVGLVHAREWISAEVPFALIHKLLDEYATDPAVKSLVDTREVVVIPILNPDGLEYSQTQYSMWRKNRSRRGDSIGVDINRNFEVGWGAGSSDSPDSDTYRGPAANSEEETRALLALVAAEHFTVTVTFHSYSELILFPWGYQSADLPGRDVFEAHSKAMQALDGYDYGSVADILYVAGGATDDTFFSKYGAWTWSFELGRQFVPPEEEIAPITRTHTAALMHLIQSAQDLAATPPPLGSWRVPAAVSHSRDTTFGLLRAIPGLRFPERPRAH